MEKRLKRYLKHLERKSQEALSFEDREALKSDLLVQLQFFQHERLIHLLVTLGFALITILVFLFSLQYEIRLLDLLVLILLALLIPYIKHYFALENGVQRLYEYYDKFAKE